MASSPLRGQHVVLGVAGGIAAYKSVELLRLLTAAGADVEVVLTREATRFVAPLTFTALSGRHARTELWDSDDPIPHTRLGQWADLVVVAPATAHLAGRVACGLADDLLTNTILATRAPVVLALAMHTEMWEQPAVVRNVATLRSDGIRCIDPESGPLAGGDSGVGRMAEPDGIVTVCEEVAGGGQTLAGRRVLVTAGGTREPIDPVRYLGNRSSGKMGHAVAVEAARRGADVIVVTTVPGDVPNDAHLKVEAVETAGEMHDAVFAHAGQSDAIVMAAAVADFRPAHVGAEKHKKADGAPEIVLESTVDILAALGDAKRSDQFLVGFAAETSDVAAAGADKVERKNLDLLVANLVGVPDSGFGSDTDRAYFCSSGGRIEDLGILHKSELAARICSRIAAGLDDER